MEEPRPPPSSLSTLKVGLLSGAVAGTVVDLSLFPLDTIKTRLQAGGIRGGSIFHGVYRGIVPALVASAPAAATFFGTYDLSKRLCSEYLPEVATHLVAAAAGDVTSSAVRLPFEKLKQRIQAGKDPNAMTAVRTIIQKEGFMGLFKGYSSLVVRELPFDLIEFPIYELFKKRWAIRKGRKLEPTESALCGSVAGAIAAAITTPLDVVKTRVMVGTEPGLSIRQHLISIGRNEGLAGLFAGLTPRVLWISFGGFIFFGGYEYTKSILEASTSQQ